MPVPFGSDVKAIFSSLLEGFSIPILTGLIKGRVDFRCVIKVTFPVGFLYLQKREEDFRKVIRV